MLVNLQSILQDAKNNKYGVGLFNAVNEEMARAVIETAEELRSPVIVGTAEVLCSNMDLCYVADYLIPLAKRANVPVCVHFDHGLTFEKCMEAIELGFSSLMYDCSTKDYESNVASVREMVEICHAKGITVEGELGHVGDNDGKGKLDNPSDFYTDPQMALDYIKRTNVDALAVAVGNAHGAYKLPPKLDFDRIKQIADITGIPLVLHGGSGLSDDDFRTATSLGICKVNIFTDIDRAGKEGIEKGIAEGKNSIYELIPYEIAAMKQVVKNKLSLFGSINRY